MAKEDSALSAAPPSAYGTSRAPDERLPCNIDIPNLAMISELARSWTKTQREQLLVEEAVIRAERVRGRMGLALKGVIATGLSFVLIFTPIGVTFGDEHWSFWASWYYSVETALGIGFGDVNVSSPAMKTLMLFECFFGTCFLAAILSLVLAQVTSRANIDARRKAASSPLADLGKGWAASQRKGLFLAWGLFAAVLAVGTAWGLVDRKWDFVTSLLFIVSACQTSGLVAPGITISDGPWPSVFVTILCMVGVPVWGYTLGATASFIAEWRLAQERLFSAVDRQRGAEEAWARRVQTVSSVCDSPESARSLPIDRAAFLELWLLRNDLVNEATLETIKVEFDSLKAPGEPDGTVELWKMSLRQRFLQLVALQLAEPGDWDEMLRAATKERQQREQGKLCCWGAES